MRFSSWLIRVESAGCVDINSGAREPSFVPSGQAYDSAVCYRLRDRSTVLLQLKAGLEPGAAANAAWRTAQ